MPEYLARYTVRAFMYDGGSFMEDPEPHNSEHRFAAKDSEEAKMLATNYMYDKEFTERFFGPSITLDELLEVKDVELKDNKV